LLHITEPNSKPLGPAVMSFSWPLLFRLGNTYVLGSDPSTEIKPYSVGTYEYYYYPI
jgi:hypothetical protein